jgi:hypothetical protein
VASSTPSATWYDVVCSANADGTGFPLGTEIKLVTTRSDYLQISGVKVYGWPYDKYEDMIYFNSDNKIEVNEANYDGTDLVFKIRATVQNTDYTQTINLNEACGRQTITVSTTTAWDFTAHKYGTD